MISFQVVHIFQCLLTVYCEADRDMMVPLNEWIQAGFSPTGRFQKRPTVWHSHGPSCGTPAFDT